MKCCFINKYLLSRCKTKNRDIPSKLYPVILSSCYFKLNEMEILFYNTPFFELDFPNSHSFLALHYKRKGGFPVTYRFTNVPAVF